MHLAVLARQHMGELVHVLFDERLEIEQHAGAALRIDARPFGKRLECGFDGLAHFGAGAERDFRLHFAGRGIEDVAKAAGCSGNTGSGDEV